MSDSAPDDSLTPDDGPAPGFDTRLDPAIVAALFVEHADELRRFVQGILRRADLAQDVLQATFVKAIEQGHTARSETRKGWLFRVAYHEALVVRRRWDVEGRAHGALAARGSHDTLGPAGQLEHRETLERVRAALDRLPPEQRRVVELRMIEDKKFATIANELGLPLGTVLTRMRSALAKLEKLLGDLR